MERIGFTRDDLASFGVEPEVERWRTVDERLRPKLEEIAYRFAAPLSRLAGRPLGAVLRMPDADRPGSQARVTFQTVGGDEVAEPFFAFAITRGGVHARLVIARENAERARFAKTLGRSATVLARELSGSGLRCYDEWDGRGVPPLGETGRAPFWKDVAGRLARDGGSLDLGVGWPEARAVLLSYEDLVPAYRALLPVFKRLG